jgi:hypothetical protein
VFSGIAFGSAGASIWVFGGSCAKSADVSVSAAPMAAAHLMNDDMSYPFVVREGIMPSRSGKAAASWLSLERGLCIVPPL